MNDELRMNPHVLTRRLAGLLLLVTSVAATGKPNIVPHLDLVALAENADIIVGGRVTDKERLERTTLGPVEGSLPAWVTMVRLDVERVIKGELEAPSVPFRMILPLEGVGAEAPRYKGVNVGQFGVFFLRRLQSGYEILDPYHPFVPAVPNAKPPKGTVIDQVVAELEQVFVSRDPSVQSRWTRWDAVKALETIVSPSASASLRAAAEDKDPLVRVWALCALLNRNDLSVLDGVEKLGPIPSDPHVENLTAHLGYAIERVSDKRAVPSLTRLLRSGDVNIRRGAASALRNTQDRLAIGPLTQALYDTDREVQYQAVIGLAEITGAASEWSPASETFEKDPKKYLDHWRDWANSRK